MGKVRTGKRGGTVVEQIVSELCRGIFRGEYAPGTKLPSLRTLAGEHDVTLPTMQRVISRMEELGIIRVRQGSGVRVLDPMTNAHPAALPYWFDALRDQPREAARLLAGFMELRIELGLGRLIAVRGERELTELEALLEDFEAGAREGMTPEEALEADFALMRGVLRLKPQIAYSSILNVFERLTRSIPELIKAMYDPPARNAAGWRAFLEQARDESISDEVLRQRVVGLLKAFDMITLARFEAELGRGEGERRWG